MNKILAVSVAVSVLGCGGKKSSDEQAGSGSGAGTPAAGSLAALGLNGPIKGRKPAAKTIKVEGKLPLDVVKKMQDEVATKKKDAKSKKKKKGGTKTAGKGAKAGKQVAAKAAPGAKRPKGHAHGEGVFVELVPRSAAKPGKGKAPKGVSKATKPDTAKIERTVIHKDGSFAFTVIPADYILVFVDDDEDWFGELSFPIGKGKPSTALLPASRPPAKAGDVLDINLGVLNVNVENWTFETTVNPLTFFDSDGDGQDDFIDTDDDNDGVDDVADLDEDGDGIDDSFYDFDSDDDGQPDVFDDDDDNDGTPDDQDTDEDGDGVDDGNDDLNGDGIEDVAEEACVDDADGDGIPDDQDPDDDNDGIPDDQDTDDDNDGIPDTVESMPAESRGF